MASGARHTVCARSKGFGVSDERGAVSSATRNPMQHTVRRRAGPGMLTAPDRLRHHPPRGPRCKRA